jgi:hypothetical protein
VVTVADRPRRSWLSSLWIYVAPLVLPWLLLFSVNALAGVAAPRRTLPREARVESRCTWACHNRGCSHRPRLPAVITSDRYLFGATVRGLFSLGTLFSRDRFEGYGIANILVFCLAWPALMYALWVRVWTQRETLLRLRAARTAGAP